MNKKAKETKTFPGYIVKADEDNGIVDAYVSIMGIIDDDCPPDLIELGAFTKTIQERGPAGLNRIRVLWQHAWNNVIGMPLVIMEHDRKQLPADVLERYPEATGGLFTRTQFVMDVQQGREAFALYKAGAMSEWSIGFDTLNFEWDQDDDEREFRRLKEIRLWEYSPVTWGANPATVTTDVKEAKPFPTEHSCRLRSPDDFQDDSFKRVSREHEGKKYHVIMGKLEDETTMTEQAYRYPKDTWDAPEARTHCKAHDGSFEAARDEDCIDDREIESIPLIEPEIDEHLEDGAEPPTALTPGEAAQSKQVGLVSLYDLVFRSVDDEREN
jgi:HK97 family phage prohead protease